MPYNPTFVIRFLLVGVVCLSILILNVDRKTLSPFYSAAGGESLPDASGFDVGFDIVCAGHVLQVELARILFGLCKKANVSVRFKEEVSRCTSPRCSPHNDGTTIWVTVVVGRSSTAAYKPGTFIVWNLDQPRLSQRDRFKGALVVWEFSKQAADFRTADNISNIQLPFLYYVDTEKDNHTITKATAATILQEHQTKDLSVCLLGSANERRTAVVQALQASNITVYYTQGKAVWGDAKLKLLSQCQIVLNIHYYSESVQEVLRILEGVAHGATVVSETATLPTENDAHLIAKAIEFVPYDETEGHVETTKRKVIQQLAKLKTITAHELVAMREDSIRLLNEWMERGAKALQQESDRLLETFCGKTVNQTLCENLAGTFKVTKSNSSSLSRSNGTSPVRSYKAASRLR